MVFPEKGLNRYRTQLDTDDFMTLLGKPNHVQTLAAEWDKYPASSSQIETGPKSGKKLIHYCLVKIGSPIAPALQPKSIIATGHDCVNIRSFILDIVIGHKEFFS